MWEAVRLDGGGQRLSRDPSSTRLQRLGGQLLVVARQPSLGHVLKFVDFQADRLERTGVETRRGTVATAAHVLSLRPDVVVVATGSVAHRPEIEGVDLAHVVTAQKVLNGDARLQGRILVVAAPNDHIAQLAVSDHLADSGFDVELVVETVDSAPRVGKRNPCISSFND